MITLYSDQQRLNTFIEKGFTFMATFSPFSAKIRGANSEPRYASRLYRALVANSATAGGPPIKNPQDE